MGRARVGRPSQLGILATSKRCANARSMGADEPLDLRRRGQHDCSSGVARRQIGWPSPARINLRVASRTGGRFLSQSERRSQQGRLGMRTGVRPQRPLVLSLARGPSPVVVRCRALRSRESVVEWHACSRCGQVEQQPQRPEGSCQECGSPYWVEAVVEPRKRTPASQQAQ
jgi:hypothetical protein